MAWDDIASISADEDRLVVAVAPREGEPVVIPPRYGGLGMYELESAIEEARDRVEREWRSQRREAGKESFYQELLGRYEVVIEKP